VFVGRLLEEILLATRANVIVLDPNADYRSIYSVIPDKEWKPASYDRASRVSKLPTERTTAGFRDFVKSKAVSFRIHTNYPSPARLPANVAYAPLHVEWGDLDASFFYDDRSTNEERSHMTAAHEFALVLTKIVLRIAHADLMTKRKAFTCRTSVASLDKFVGKSAASLTRALTTRAGAEAANLSEPIRLAGELGQFVTPDIWREYRQAVSHLEFEEVVTQDCSFIWDASEPARVQVFDLSSVSHAYRGRIAEEVLSSALGRAKARWTAALKEPAANDARVPTFIVLEEAHHLVPSANAVTQEPGFGASAREIAAEGRKYGLFLLLVTQRADRLDPIVLSEVENISILGLNTPHALDCTVEAFGLKHESRQQLESVLRFPAGRALLLGRWVDYSPRLLYVAMRRTVEGGRNLRAEKWALPPVW
jgi:hypothetical protein